MRGQVVRRFSGCAAALKQLQAAPGAGSDKLGVPSPFASHNKAPDSGEDIETQFPLENFPAPQRLWDRYKGHRSLCQDHYLLRRPEIARHSEEAAVMSGTAPARRLRQLFDDMLGAPFVAPSGNRLEDLGQPLIVASVLVFS